MMRVLSSGFASFQDEGRFGFRQKGIPYAGAMDKDAFRLCNVLLGNAENTPMIEYSKTGLIIQALQPFWFCVIGQVEGIKRNEVILSTGKVYYVGEGDVLDTGKVRGGTFAYLGIAGVYKGTKILGSYSDMEHVHKQDLNALNFQLRQDAFYNQSRLSPIFTSGKTVHLDCFPGPEWPLLLAEAKEKIKASTFHLSRETWRMGFTLLERIENELPAIASAPVLPGTVQCTPSGKMIVLMKDAQTTGGYPRILQLTKDAIHNLVRVGWGGKIKFDVYL